MTVLGFQITGPVLVLGVVTGMTYGILAVGLVLIYRANRLINFAYGEIGALGASFLGVAVVRWHIPYWIAFIGALIVAGFAAAIAEIAVVRRLRNAPPLMSVVATLGFAQFLLLLTLNFNSQVQLSSRFPQPAGFPTFNVGPLTVTSAQSAMLILTPGVVVALVIFLRRSRYGLAIRAAAANPRAARTSAVSVGRMATLAWVLAGLISAYAAVLIFPTKGFVTGQSLGPDLLVRALVPAIVARMSSMPVALLAGVLEGIIEQVIFWNYPAGGIVEVVLLGVVLVVLLTQRKSLGRGGPDTGWVYVTTWRKLSRSWRTSWVIRNIGWLTGAFAIAMACVVGLLVTNNTAVSLAQIVAFIIIGVSLGVVTGLSGQLSLAQFALGGIGAIAAYEVTSRIGNYPIAFLAAGLATAAVSVLVGLPAIRISALMLSVTTLAFALVCEAWLFQQSWLLGSGRVPGSPRIAGVAAQTGRQYYFFTLIPLTLSFWLGRNIWRSGLGRRMRAVRDNEQHARAFTLSAPRIRLEAFAISGFLAGIGGATYGYLLSVIDPSAFPITANIDVVAVTVVGGIGVLIGPALGALYILGVPKFLPLDSAGLAATSLGWLLLILYYPGGLAQAFGPLHSRAIRFLGKLLALDQDVLDVGPVTEAPKPVLAGTAAPRRERSEDSHASLLRVEQLTKSYGGLRAVRDVSFTIDTYETVGLIGPNGAGKTTLFELISGFVRPTSGEVIFAGENITRYSPERRGKLGLIRSFQDAGLFPSLTVLETIEVALECKMPTPFIRTTLGARRVGRDQTARALELIDLMGLGRFIDRKVGELSTGTRRILELSCVIGLEPRLLLLDEPSTGIAQRETEALADLLVRIRNEFSLTMILIEHDMPLVMGVSDRVIALVAGEVIVEGPPATVQADARVVEAYLGSDAKWEKKLHTRGTQGAAATATAATARDVRARS